MQGNNEHQIQDSGYSQGERERERNETGVRYTGGEEATNVSIMLYLKLDYGYRSLI